jgi:hypothetical protein
MSGEHTAGPWAILRGFPNTIVRAIDQDKLNGVSIYEKEDRERFAVVIATAEDNRHSGFAHKISEAEAKANARLIAAAPETAAERDRLRAEVEHWKRAAEDVGAVWKGRVEALRAEKAELVAALERMLAGSESSAVRTNYLKAAQDTARTALTKAAATEGGE